MPYVTVTLLFVVLLLGFDFNGLYGQDAHEYYRYSKALGSFFENGTNPGDFIWPKLFPLLGTCISYLGIPEGFALQLVSLFAVFGCIYFAQKSLQLLYHTSGGWFLLLAAATQVYFVRSGLLVMSDALAACCVMGFVFFYLKFHKDQRFKHFSWMLFFAVIGVFSRYAVIPLIAIPLLHGIWIFIRKRKVLFQILIGVVVITIGCLLLYANNKALDVRSSPIGAWNPVHLFQRNFIYESHGEHYWVPNGMYIWSNFAHLGYLSCGVLLLFWWRRWNREFVFLWIGILCYLIFLGGIGFQNQRFMVISHLPVLILIFPAFEALIEWLKLRKIQMLFISGVLLLNAAFFYYSFSKMFSMHRFEKVVAERAMQLDDDRTIYSFYITASLGSYDVPNERIDLWEKDIDFQQGGYIIFNPQRFADNQRVMKNWHVVNRTFDLEIIDELPENWNIYRIQ